jgi:CO/xanthine dehydrogenase Mo-binding subunit
MARIDAWPKVKGQAHYVADAVPRPCLYGALLVTTSAHCRVSVEKQFLAAQPGIIAVVDHTDVIETRFSTNPHGGPADTHIFTNTGLHPGDIVGAIAATDRGALKRALALKGAVSEQPLAAVLNLGDGLQAHVIANEQYPFNVISDQRIGDPAATVAAGLDDAPMQHESFASFDAAPHGFMEPVAAAAQWAEDHWEVWSPSQCPALVRARLDHLFATRCQLMPVYLGGGFGGKEEMSIEPAAIVLSRACGGQTVLIETTRQQMTTAYRARHGGYIRLNTGFDATGVFLARDIDVVLEAGPYNGHSSDVASNAADTAARLYRAPVVAARHRAIATNRMPGGGFRGYGGIQAAYAVETHIDEIAKTLGLDPVAMRLRNVPRDGDRDPVNGSLMHGMRGAECLQLLQERWLQTGPDAARVPRAVGRFKTGRGLAMVMAGSAAAGAGHPDRAEVACQLDPDTGMVTIQTSVAEAGQGTYPLLALTVSRELALDQSRIAIEYDASEQGPHDPGMFGSRGANVTGSAAMIAAILLRVAMIKEAALLLEVDPEQVEIAPDWTGLRVRDGEDTVKISELPPLRVVGAHETSDPGLAYGVQCADVTVDTHTGTVTVDRIIAVHDIGVVQDYDGAKAQIEGAAVQGIGAALSERATFRGDGSVVERGFLTHLIPTCVAIPPVDVAFLDAPPMVGATGAKGLGEASIIGIPAAIGNAVAAAIGTRPRALPITPERLTRAIEASRAAPSTVEPPGRQAAPHVTATESEITTAR